MANIKHKEVIQAWLEGKTVQFKYPSGRWEDCEDYGADFNEDIEYRIKPAEPEREYPVTQMSAKEAYMAFSKIEETDSNHWGDNVLSAINAGLRHACDNGQIVTRSEFDRAVGDRQKRDMAVAKAVARQFSNGLGRSELIALEVIISEVK